MKTIISIKKDLEFNRGLSSLIEVLKNIAVAQFRVLEQQIKTFEKFHAVIESFFDFIDPGLVNHPFVNAGDKPQAVVAVTSDSGLLGGLNVKVIGDALAELKERPGKLIVIGERGKNYAKEGNIACVAFPGITEEARYAQAMQLRDYCVSRFLDGSFGMLKVVYPRPVSFTVQRVETMAFLPYNPAKKKESQNIEVIFESRAADIIEYLLYNWIGQKFYEIFGLSRLAEFAARFVHLEESHQNLKERNAKVQLEYFRTRHELIDRNMRELYSSRLLFNA